ncbi:ABC-F family ATP-binding cassette domain-containing protein [Rubellicoccus peritrichatus]|uniref:ABC-F family ATP-binding cassette domain-containing protein n=1 Tax=Rubellicoccus peritrichatus TaxID=3080537 RepID=A0AAQ3LBT6_9BACT|nr:ABC-F family ATP-binding cassette domain-containing protein [Puniceicoccus sp. CR14]WOO40990.1 ABC-F family ATP-binding cassette domain-containing protein [Puniceicoccus sp. CR14]
MLQVSQLSKAYGGQQLFEDVSFRIERTNRVALVGPNGAGKTTLFSLILGEGETDSGEIVMERNASLGHLPQETAPKGDETVIEIAAGITPEHAKARRIIGEHERNGQTDSEEYHEAVARYTELGGYQTEPKAKRILAGLAFRDTDYDRPACELSGGWVMRAYLARLLTAEPDLLMLDEPTNHLDLESLEWFQNYLRNYPGAIFLISHDRAFLNALVDGILEIRHHRVHTYNGNYDYYVEEAAARDAQHEAAYKSQQRKIQQLERFVERFGAKNTKATQAKSKQKQIDRMEKIDAPLTAEKTIHVKFPQPPSSGQRVITLEGVHFAYGDHVVYRGIDFQAQKNQRTVLVGPNGAGKSTLLKLLAGVLKPNQGECTLGHNVQPGYYAQSRLDMLDPDTSVLDEVLSINKPITEVTARTVLGSFLFRGDAVFKRVSVLSGGEKSRLALVKLLLDPPNLLLMDEPTTHLDMASIDALIAALKDYTGTLIFISHDVYFIRQLASTVLRISAGELTAYAGDYDYYLHKSESTNARAALTFGDKLSNLRPEDAVKQKESGSQADPNFKSKEQKRAEAQARQARAKIRAEVEELENKICKLEDQQKALTNQLEDPDLYDSNPGKVMELNRELVAVNEDLEVLNERWMEATEKLEA